MMKSLAFYHGDLALWVTLVSAMILTMKGLEVTQQLMSGILNLMRCDLSD